MKCSNCNMTNHTRNWHTVPSPSFNRHKRLQHVIDWCREHPSKGGFYFQYATHPAWYFENKDDALLFTLQWGA